MNELISIIIPVYKVEKYINRCVCSVLGQTYTNLEIILVDDGSPDDCGKICDEFAIRDSRIQVYHKSNGGLSDARNYGVERANGQYVTFLDSDDYIAPNYIEYLYDLIKMCNVDISCCCMVETHGDVADYGINSALPEKQILTNKEACKALFGDLYMVLVTAWGKLYKRELVYANPFPVGRIHEDEATTCKYYYNSKNVVVGNRCLYAYYQNPESITRINPGEFREDKFWSLGHRAEYFEDKKEVYLAKCSWEMLFNYYVNDSLQNDGRCDVFLKGYARGKHLFPGTKRRLFLYNISPRLYEWYIKIKGLILK